MRLYEASINEFSADVIHNRIADKLRDNFLAYYDPAPKNCTVYKLSLQVYNRNERGLKYGKAQVYRRADNWYFKEA